LKTAEAPSHKNKETTMNKKIARSLAAVGVLSAAFSLPASAAENWPTGPIRLIVSYGAGGSLDEIARVLAKGLTTVLHESVIIENVPGADGMIGVRRAIASPPDGSTFLVGITSDVALAPLVNAGAHYTSSARQASVRFKKSRCSP
jgi:tripartite-type tricarboxylate transporter receptor subunit TctC